MNPTVWELQARSMTEENERHGAAWLVIRTNEAGALCYSVNSHAGPLTAEWTDKARAESALEFWTRKRPGSLRPYPKQYYADAGAWEAAR